MTDSQRLKRRIIHTAQRLVVNPVGRRLPVTQLETTGRKSGQPRRTAIGGRIIGDQFWMVSEHGAHSHYVHNIRANPAVRVRIGDQWRTGTAHLMPEDDAKERLRSLPGINSALVRLMGSDLLTIRVDLD
ncbi:nitroreductase/quinone reductase family protein [Mycobacterium sp.]|uniref:nitroreductase/quinone reductase family protein n=1 Tax=Mycobacterium sp. TaxID=1785 RepID=UPI003F97F5F5